MKNYLREARIIAIIANILAVVVPTTTFTVGLKALTLIFAHKYGHEGFEAYFASNSIALLTLAIALITSLVLTLYGIHKLKKTKTHTSIFLRILFALPLIGIFSLAIYALFFSSFKTYPSILVAISISIIIASLIAFVIVRTLPKPPKS